jgi:uncharacterized membrane protein YccC
VHLSTIRDSALRGMRLGKPLGGGVQLLRVAIGMLVALTIGYLTGDQTAVMMICTGALLAALAALMPHNRTRVVAALLTVVFQILAAAAALAIGPQWWLVLPLIFLGFFATGMLRAVAIGVSMRCLIVTVVFLDFAETGVDFSDKSSALFYFIVGAVVMAASQLLPPYGSRHSVQRRAVSQFYRRLASGESSGAALLAADRSLALLAADRSLALLYRRSSHGELARLSQLVERGEQIGQLLLLLDGRTSSDENPWRTTVSTRLAGIAAQLGTPGRGGSRAQDPTPQRSASQNSATPRPSSQDHAGPQSTESAAPTDQIEAELLRALESAERIASGLDAPAASDERRTPGPWELIRGEMHRHSPVLHHALRLSVACVIGQTVGLVLERTVHVDGVLPHHSFWIVVAIALTMLPDYSDTFAKGIGCFIGSAAGALLAIGIAFLAPGMLVHTLLLFVFFCGHIAFRSAGTPYALFFLVALIASMTPGPEAGFTRGLDTLIGCIIGLAVFLTAPTWQRKQIPGRLADWSAAEAHRLRTLVQLWSEDTEARRLKLAESTVDSRIARLELLRALSTALTEPPLRDGRWDNEALNSIQSDVTVSTRSIAALAAVPATQHPAARGTLEAQLAEAEAGMRSIHSWASHAGRGSRSSRAGHPSSAPGSTGEAQTSEDESPSSGTGSTSKAQTPEHEGHSPAPSGTTGLAHEGQDQPSAEAADCTRALAGLARAQEGLSTMLEAQVRG